MKTITSFLVCLVVVASAVDAAKILGVFMVPSHSHQVVFQPIWRELSLRGHDVTVYTPNPINDPTLTNLTEIDMSFSYDVWRKFGSGNFQKSSKVEEVRNLFKGFAAVYEAQMSSPQMQDLLARKNNETFDLFLVEYLFPSMYAFKDVFNCPMVGVTSLPLTSGATEALGMIKHPAIDPEFLMTFSSASTLKDRVASVLVYILGKINMAFKLGPELDALCKKYFGPDTKHVSTLTREINLVLGNFNYVTQNIRPQVPNFVEIPGIHLKPEKPLPKDLKKFLDDSKEGVVYFSLGSNVRSSSLPKNKLEAILSAFSELPYKVLFKFESDDLKNITDVSSNIETRKWIPQQDVLRHPNVKLFVTQGGLQSIDEALNAKKPILVIPFFGDQHFNAHKMEDAGMALSIDFNELTKESLVEKINEMVRNPKYKETAEELGSRAFDHQVPPLEKAVWWIEYVLRHKGADHLRYKAAKMPFYQFYLLDVFLFLGTVSVTILYVTYKVSKKLVGIPRFIYKFLLKSSTGSKKSQ